MLEGEESESPLLLGTGASEQWVIKGILSLQAVSERLPGFRNPGTYELSEATVSQSCIPTFIWLCLKGRKSLLLFWEPPKKSQGIVSSLFFLCPIMHTVLKLYLVFVCSFVHVLLPCKSLSSGGDF